MSFDERASGSDIGNFVTNTNGYLTLGDTAYGNISGAGGLGGDHDVYALQTQPGVTYTVVMRGAAWPGVAATPNPSPYFVVRNAAGTILGQSADVDGNQAFVFTGTALQQLFVDAQGTLVSSTGGYALGVASNVADDFSGAVPGLLDTGVQLGGRLETVGDDDPLLASIWAGTGYFFASYSAAVPDLAVTIKTTGGQTAVYDSISPGKGGSFVAPADTTYSLHVTSGSLRQVGEYQVFFQERFDTSMSLSVGSYLADNIAFADSNPRELWGWAGNDTLRTGLSNDFLAGGAGDDSLDAGPGVDLAYFAGPSANFKVAKSGVTWKVTEKFFGAEGTDTLRNVEAIVFADKAFMLANLPRQGVPAYNTDSGFLFDAAYYLLDNAELVPEVDPLTALFHYFAAGSAQGMAPNSWFDATWYENRWPDLTPYQFDDATLFRHYNLYGVWEGRSAGPEFDKFDGNRYLADNPDVAAYVDSHLPDFLGSRSNGAIAHYVIYGQHELRPAFDLVGQPIDLGYTVDLGG